MTSTTKRFNITALAIATAVVFVIHGSMLMGFDRLASNGHNSPQAASHLAKSSTARPTVTLERVVISTRRA